MIQSQSLYCFAQVIPTSTPTDMGLWLFALAGLLGVSWIGRQLWVSFFPNLGEGDRYVTRQELRDMERSMKEEIASVKVDLLEKLADGRNSVKELITYVHESQHKQNEVLNKIALSVAVIEELRKNEAKIKT